MVVLRVYRAQISQLPETAWQAITESLSPSLHPVIHPALDSQARILRLGPELLGGERKIRPAPFELDRRSPIIDAEIFTDGANLFVIAIEQRNRERMPRLVRGRVVSTSPGT